MQILATLRSLAMNALRLDGFWSITEGLAALSHDIKGASVTAGLARTDTGTQFCMTSKSLRKNRLTGRSFFLLSVARAPFDLVCSDSAAQKTRFQAFCLAGAA